MFSQNQVHLESYFTSFVVLFLEAYGFVGKNRIVSSFPNAICSVFLTKHVRPKISDRSIITGGMGYKMVAGSSEVLPIQ